MGGPDRQKGRQELSTMPCWLVRAVCSSRATPKECVYYPNTLFGEKKKEKKNSNRSPKLSPIYSGRQKSTDDQVNISAPVHSPIRRIPPCPLRFPPREQQDPSSAAPSRAQGWRRSEGRWRRVKAAPEGQRAPANPFYLSPIGVGDRTD